MQQKTSRTFTYQTRLITDDKLDEILTKQAKILSKVERHLLVDYYHKNKNINELKSQYLKKFNITARQFNSCRIKLEGKVKSVQKLFKKTLGLLEDKIKKIKKYINKLKDPFKFHQKRRRLSLLESKLKNLKSEDKPGICVGSKKLFQKQFHLEENGYSSHSEWKKQWDSARNSSFFLIGSKDETAGNQSCQLIRKNESWILQLRLSNCFSDKIINIENVSFSYGEEEILHCVEENEKRRHLRLTGQKYSDFGKAINYLFRKDEKGWRVFVTLEKEKPEQKSKDNLGMIGVDINAHHIAISETDRFGNIINKKSISCSTYGKNKNQSLAIIGEASKEIANIALQTEKPLVLENLDFEEKKISLREKNNKYNRMLSSFSYNKIITSIETLAFKKGIKTYTINPAFTSIIGKVKFAQRHGLSNHHAAALVIARRACNYSERPTSYLEIINSDNSKSAFSLPARNREKHVWSYYSELTKKLKAANVLHSSTKFRSLRL
jgi:IS605 OrfB family transposase